MSLRLAKVAAIHPEDNSVDLLFMDNGQRAVGAQLLSDGASTRTGVVDLPVPDPTPSGDPWDPVFNYTKDVLAIAGFYGNKAVVMGFLYPQQNQMLFAEAGRRIERHGSDFYTSLDALGNFEAYHPSGTYFRMGTSPDHEDLTAKDSDGRWKIDKNTDTAIHVHLRVSNAGEQKASVDLDPDGNIDLDHTGSLTTNTGGNLSASVTGTATVNITGAATVTAETIDIHGPTTFHDEVTVLGLLTYSAGLAGSGGGADAAVITGNLRVVSGEVSADGIGLKGHHHGDVQNGPDSTSNAIA